MNSSYLTAITARDFQLFLKACELESFTLAGAASGMIQPGFSRVMRLLEDRVAHPLCHRIGRGVKLTDAGVLLNEFATQYLRNLEVLQTSMDQLAGAIPSRVSIVIPRLVGRFLIPPLVKLGDNRWPDTTFTIHEKLGASIPMAVQLGEFNFGIAYVHSKGSQSLREQIAIEYLRLVGTGAMIGATDAAISLKEVAQLPLALPTKQSPYRKLIEMVCSRGRARTECCP